MCVSAGDGTSKDQNSALAPHTRRPTHIGIAVGLAVAEHSHSRETVAVIRKRHRHMNGLLRALLHGPENGARTQPTPTGRGQE